MCSAATPATPPPLAGILLCNLGSPAAPTPRALRPYLREFLGDPRIVETPGVLRRLLWLLVLNLIVIPRRHRRSARLYRSIWSDAGSPLVVTSQGLAAALQELLQNRLGRDLPVVAAMRYGAPSIAGGLHSLRQAGCRRMLVLPLFPQYSATTTASVLDRVAQVFAGWRRQPELRTICDYHDNDRYLAALAASVTEHQDRHGRPDRLLLSFHGIPQSYADAGDPYPQQCLATAGALSGRLGREPGSWATAFQSRFGRGRWLSPATDQVLQEWGREGVRRADVLCPGFAADCLETLEEIAVGCRELFMAAGGETLRYIPALNDRDDHVEALAALAAQHLGGWV